MTPIEEMIYSLLASDADVSDRVSFELDNGDTRYRISPVLRQADTDVPAIGYQVIDQIRHRNTGGATGWVESRWQLNCWAATPDAALELAEAVIGSLDNFSGGGIDQISVIDEADLPSVKPDNEALTVFGRRLDVQIFYNE